MFAEITSAEPLEGHQLRLRFDDGSEGVVDVGALIRFEGVADLDPVVLWSVATGQSINFEWPIPA
ncbi:MAG: DUF2442 domain-containing protein [Bryobacteraceae bacterium]